LNFSHGDHAFHKEVIVNLRGILERRKQSVGKVAIMMDTRGPAIRTGKLEKPTFKVTKGMELIVTPDTKIIGNEKKNCDRLSRPSFFLQSWWIHFDCRWKHCIANKRH